jgi:glutaconyl-CoA/methylmalonyl-CoA decarboxylase subunit gamma
MRITLERDGKKQVVDVANDLTAATIEGRTFPVRVVAESAEKVELEIDGQKVVVEGWPEHFPEPPGPVDVNGERWKVGIERESRAGPVGPRGAKTSARAPSSGSAVNPSTSPHPEGGVAIVPPMPGRVIEVRVQEGQAVEKGSVLLVLEAMKMRNEVASPVAGTVRDIAVAAGTNARAREPMMFVVPAAGT